MSQDGLGIMEKNVAKATGTDHRSDLLSGTQDRNKSRDKATHKTYHGLLKIEATATHNNIPWL